MKDIAPRVDNITFVLDADHNIVPHADDEAWFEWYMVVTNRRVAQTFLPGDVTVSTVFTGLDLTPDHCLFETMVFGGEHGREYWRSKTWDEAAAKHDEIVAKLKTRLRRRKRSTTR